MHDDNPANANLPRQAPCHCGAPQVIIKIKVIIIIITIMIIDQSLLKAIAPQEEHRSRARRKLDAIEGFRGHATINEDEEEDLMSVDSRTGLVQVFLVNVLILPNPIIIILTQGMVVNVLMPSS